MTIQLRKYQIDALNALDSEFQQSKVALLHAIMGSGKTVSAVRLINSYYKSRPHFRFVILAHKQELVEQFHKTFLGKSDIPDSDIGICCAGLGKAETKKRVTIATIQSYQKKEAHTDLLVVDEVHRCGWGNNSQYHNSISFLWEINPDMRVLGLTATPFRLGHGYIYGSNCKVGSFNLFPHVTHQIKYAELLAQGYLVPLIGKAELSDAMKRDIKGVTVRGDFLLSDLGDMMSRPIHISTAKQAIDIHCVGYRCICVFACTISHAEALVDAIGEEATIVHSRLSPQARKDNLDKWKSGKARIMVSINILVDGFDFPPMDCLVFARPTMSSALYLQALGRVLRASPNKEHALVVDLTDNTARFGTDIDRVRVSIPKCIEEQNKRENVKTCPECGANVHTALRVCDCGYPWEYAPQKIAGDLPDLQSVSYAGAIPEWQAVTGFRCVSHTSKDTNKQLGRIILEYGENYTPQTVSIWLCFADYYSGGAVKGAFQKWQKLSDEPFPQTVGEFMFLHKSIVPPSEVLVEKTGKWANAIAFNWDTPNIKEDIKEDIPESEVPF